MSFHLYLIGCRKYPLFMKVECLHAKFFTTKSSYLAPPFVFITVFNFLFVENMRISFHYRLNVTLLLLSKYLCLPPEFKKPLSVYDFYCHTYEAHTVLYMNLNTLQRHWKEEKKLLRKYFAKHYKSYEKILKLTAEPIIWTIITSDINISRITQHQFEWLT